MKKTKAILLRVILYITALQILNLSIDMDYIAFTNSSLIGLADRDDIDSFTEYILEKIVGDESYTSEQDDDEGNPQNKGIEKYDSGPLYFDSHIRVPLYINSQYASSWTTGLDQSNRTCKGYFTIVCPPPEA